MARVQTPARLALLVFGDDLIAGLYRDDLGVEQLRVHRLERTASRRE